MGVELFNKKKKIIIIKVQVRLRILIESNGYNITNTLPT